jgi:hypothetical protein
MFIYNPLDSDFSRFLMKTIGERPADAGPPVVFIIGRGVWRHGLWERRMLQGFNGPQACLAT